jgi:hypothetical protein
LNTHKKNLKKKKRIYTFIQHLPSRRRDDIMFLFGNKYNMFEIVIIIKKIILRFVYFNRVHNILSNQIDHTSNTPYYTNTIIFH